MSDNKKGTNTTTYTGRDQPSGKPGSDYISHGLKPTAPGTRPTTKPGPGPKTK